MDLFYVLPHQLDLGHGRASIDGEEFHHLARVLRCREGDTVPVTDGSGFSAELVVESIGKRELQGSICNQRRVPPPETRVSVAMSLLKAPQRFDFFLEKATELGIDRIIPIITQRTVSTPDLKKIDRKAERWRNIVHSAARQSRRYYLPELSTPCSFQEALQLEGYDLQLIAHESEEAFGPFEPAGQRVLFFIGPEGGFTESEISTAAQSGVRPVSFGASVLRAETAGVFAVALVRSALLGLSASMQL
ncbi:MAG TPA: 16S rRNA (uracil(1498)-N(3))-methyltransferase [Chlorobaculum parvum]|uniref:Ribosomal RNA small subunit methyltransferase E n=1 Tax=Chlorobaculum parvum TaxID=274539 RepID=A0A7C5H922_9CHLB|nr:16S rRNA (uracil(1498)-N(3))-methyltransferase [Chlorobaculum parvum]